MLSFLHMQQVSQYFQLKAAKASWQRLLAEYKLNFTYRIDNEEILL